MNTTSILPLPSSFKLELFEDQVNDLLKSNKIGGTTLMGHIQEHFPVFLELKDYIIQPEKFTSTEAEIIVARSYGFESWQQFKIFIKEISIKTSLVAQFEAAADSIISGDLQTLKLLLEENTDLVRTRSMRVHEATLLHYISANGIEDFRQKTPGNAIAIADILLHTGAEVDAVLADGQSTTLGLVATSIHPWLAGSQIALMDMLLKAGAAVDGVPGGWKPLDAALANGCPEAARFLASQGTELSHIIANRSPDPGWLQSFLNTEGGLRPELTRAQIEAGLMWACDQGQYQVVRTLIEKGADQHSLQYTGLTALHWAVAAGQIFTIRILLKYGASLERKNIYGGDALDQALSWHMHGKPLDNFVQIIEVLLESGAKPEKGTLSWLKKQNNLSSHTKLQVEKVLHHYDADN